MERKELLLKSVAMLKGIFLPYIKASAEQETVIMPPPRVVKIPLLQHIGTAARAVVKKGDKVYVGTLIGKAYGLMSVPVHSSVSGTVKEIAVLEGGGKCVVIESDGLLKPDPELTPFEVKTKKDLVSAADKCGLVGLGGAGFPTKVKLTVKANSNIDTLIINAAECEPYVTSDYRECIEGCNDIIEGAYLLKKVLKIPNVIICVGSDKKQAYQKLYEALSDKCDNDDSVKLMKLQTKYPQGEEKFIVYSATARKVPLGEQPADVGCIVMNVTSVATLHRFIRTGMPLVSKRVTVDGTAVAEPKNVIVPIGTSVKELLDFVGGIDVATDEIIMGGPMTGVSVNSENAVIEKRNNAITVMKPQSKVTPTTACIRCGRCADACPMQLYPALVDAAISSQRPKNKVYLNAEYCIECGSCSFVCPAKRPLTENMRLAKEKFKEEG